MGKLFQIIGANYDHDFRAEHVLFDACFSSKTEDIVFIWSWPVGLYI